MGVTVGNAECGSGLSVGTAAMKLEQRAQFALVAGHLLFRRDANLDVGSEPATRGFEVRHHTSRRAWRGAVLLSGGRAGRSIRLAGLGSGMLRPGRWA